LAVEPVAVAVPVAVASAESRVPGRPGGLNAPAAAAVTGMPQRVWGARWCVSVCGAPMVHKRGGRPKQFCSGDCD